METATRAARRTATSPTENRTKNHDEYNKSDDENSTKKNKTVYSLIEFQFN